MTQIRKLGDGELIEKEGENGIRDGIDSSRLEWEDSER